MGSPSVSVDHFPWNSVQVSVISTARKKVPSIVALDIAVFGLKVGVFIGSELAFNLNLKAGDNISLMSSAFVATPLGSLPKQENFKIAGTFNTGFLEFDQNIVFLDIQDVLTIFDKEDKDKSIEIYLENPLEANVYKKKIQKINQNYFIYTWADLNKSFFSALKVERNVMFIILTLIVIVAAFNIISGLTILIKNKTKEIAI